MDEAKARQAIADHFGIPPDAVVDAADFRALGADSLDLIELSLALEHALDISIPDEVTDSCVTVGEAMAFLRNLSDPGSTTGVSPAPLLVETLV